MFYVVVGAIILGLLLMVSYIKVESNEFVIIKSTLGENKRFLLKSGFIVPFFESVYSSKNFKPFKIDSIILDPVLTKDGFRISASGDVTKKISKDPQLIKMYVDNYFRENTTSIITDLQNSFFKVAKKMTFDEIANNKDGFLRKVEEHFISVIFEKGLKLESFNIGEIVFLDESN